MTRAGPPLLELVQAGKRFAGVTALHPTSLEVEAGRTMVLIGPSGCGKTTALRLMLGLTEPDSGSVRFRGTELEPRALAEERRRMGYVVQDGGLFPHLTALGNVTLMARYLGWDSRAIEARLHELAELVRLPLASLARYPAELSGGQQQRVALMRALMLDPELLFLDEPLGALDPLVRVELQDDLRVVFARPEQTVVFVTHDLAEAALFADVIVLMKDGQVVQRGSLERDAGVPVTRRPALGGTRLVWDALVEGSIDVYPEYTGTLVNEVLVRDGAPLATATADPRAALLRALAEHGVGMTAALGFTRARATTLGATKISDLRSHPELRFGFSNEFMSRRDGWPALRARYGLSQENVRGLDHDLAYRALTSGAIDVTDVYTTDAELRRYALVPLEDDAKFFERYDAVFLYRLDVTRRFGARALDALGRLSGRIDAETMASLNARAKLDHVPEAEVAREFAKRTWGTSAPAARATLGQRLLARTLEHLSLVGVSLTAAIVVALPLGMVAARRRRVGRAVLALAGVIQTLPTLALLVFMIPLFGIGAGPAIAALFLYSLLPIVRNTHAGLTGIPASLLESARALGLPPRAILIRVELPLASPTILAGIQSAAVINVGTATLGALIGAGGLGQAIFTGIRLDDLGLILEGAIPASLLALFVQAAFELLERRLVPRGLRLGRT